MNTQRGFTLIEAMVATLITALAATSLYSYMSTAINLEQAQRETAQAHEIALDRMIADRAGISARLRELPQGYQLDKRVIRNAMPFADLHQYQVQMPSGRTYQFNDYRVQ